MSQYLGYIQLYGKETRCPSIKVIYSCTVRRQDVPVLRVYTVVR